MKICSIKLMFTRTWWCLGIFRIPFETCWIGIRWSWWWTEYCWRGRHWRARKVFERAHLGEIWTRSQPPGSNRLPFENIPSQWHPLSGTYKMIYARKWVCPSPLVGVTRGFGGVGSAELRSRLIFEWMWLSQDFAILILALYSIHNYYIRDRIRSYSPFKTRIGSHVGRVGPKKLLVQV